MRVLYFAQARLATGRSEENFTPIHPMKAEVFWDLVTQNHPSLLPLQYSCRLAKNGSFLQPGEMLGPEDDVAILPPVSGG